MFVFKGVFNFDHNVVNGEIVVVVPGSQNAGERCLMYWQWTLMNNGDQNVDAEFVGKFAEQTGGGFDFASRDVEHPQYACLSTEDTFYWFLWNIQTNTLQLRNRWDTLCGRTIQLTQVFPVSYTEKVLPCSITFHHPAANPYAGSLIAWPGSTWADDVSRGI